MDCDAPLPATGEMIHAKDLYTKRQRKFVEKVKEKRDFAFMLRNMYIGNAGQGKANLGK